ncbi:MAG: PhnD/SsuA/transferrin family substrate-binding protein [Deltaproteobacteria bacterium]|nr:PhnD/SsuA/transferrin family substrate-binding protein [Deltaproteobacteria bacterium]
MREVDRSFQSVFIAHKDSGLTSLSGLEGKRFSFGSKGSTSGHLMPRHHLASKYSLSPECDFKGRSSFF